MKDDSVKDTPAALVVVLDDIDTAIRVVHELNQPGFWPRKIELVTRDVLAEAPELNTSTVNKTTAGSMVGSSGKWGGIGAGIGLAAGVLTAFPGLALGMVIMGGMTGAIVGGMAGIDEAQENDAADLPNLEEYQELVNGGNSLVVVVDMHAKVQQAEAIIKKMFNVRSHVHPVHGHLFHEHTV